MTTKNIDQRGTHNLNNQNANKCPIQSPNQWFNLLHKGPYWFMQIWTLYLHLYLASYMPYILFNKNFEPHSLKYFFIIFATHTLVFLIKNSHMWTSILYVVHYLCELEYRLEWNEPYYKHGIFSKWLIFSDILVKCNIYHIVVKWYDIWLQFSNSHVSK